MRRLTDVFVACQPGVFAGIHLRCESCASSHDRAAAETGGDPAVISGTDPDRKIDTELLARAAKGDEDAFAQFYRRFADGLYSLALKMVNDSKEAEDVLQDGFAYMWRRAFTYDPARSSPFTWAVMIVRHKAIDRMRSRQRQARILEKATAELSQLDTADESSAAEPARRERCAQVRAALTDMPGEQKQAVELAFFRGLTHEQIAQELGTPLGTIKARIRRGLLRLRDALKGAE